MAGDASHGSTPAAWTTVAILLIATVIGGIALILGNWPLFWIGGAGLVVVGLIVGKAMSVSARNKSSDAESRTSAAEREAGATSS